MRNCEVRDIGRIGYAQAFELQSESVARRKRGEISDQLLIVEHPHVITMGRNGHEDNVLASPEVLSRAGIEYHRTDRGGDVTYHGPGQIVAYPVIDLREWKRDVVAYVRAIEQVVIDALASFRIIGERDTKATGVWVDGRKICAIGVHISRWVTSHGFALNVDTDLSYFQYIVPCGLTKPVTSIRALGCRASREEVTAAVVREFGHTFDLHMMQEALVSRGDAMTDVVMPQMGESIVEGTLTKWLKKPGERIERDEPLFEISTDKVDTEIPSPAAGTLSEVLVEEGKTVAINTVVARIDEAGGAAAAAPAPKTEEAPAPPPPPPPAATSAATPTPPPAEPPQREPAPSGEADTVAGPLSPLVRRMAREYNIDLKQVKGTGAGGRITKTDVEGYMAAQGAKTVAASQTPAPEAAAPTSAPPMPRAEAARTRVEPMSTMRQKIAEHMVMSKRVSAHVTTVHKVDMTKIAKLRDRQKAEFQARYGFGLTFLPFVARAAADALRAFPIVNASIEGTNILYHNEINIGIAVALENGLIVPVIRNADEKNVVGLQRSIVDLATRSRSRQLKPDEVQGGTFSITNFGSFGSIFATPVINQPQVAILGAGAVTKEPVVVDDAIAIRSTCFLSLTFDHRLIDGALGDQFCQKVKSILENWSEEVL